MFEGDEGEIPIKIELLGGLGSLDGVIMRYLSPISADNILEKMPIVLRGRFGFGSKKYWTLMNVGIHKGPDLKAKKNVEKGDIVYNPKSDEIIIIFEDLELPNKVNRLGKVLANIDLFQNARNGLNCKLTIK